MVWKYLFGSDEEEQAQPHVQAAVAEMPLTGAVPNVVADGPSELGSGPNLEPPTPPKPEVTLDLVEGGLVDTPKEIGVNDELNTGFWEKKNEASTPPLTVESGSLDLGDLGKVLATETDPNPPVIKEKEAVPVENVEKKKEEAPTEKESDAVPFSAEMDSFVHRDDNKIAEATREKDPLSELKVVQSAANEQAAKTRADIAKLEADMEEIRNKLDARKDSLTHIETVVIPQINEMVAREQKIKENQSKLKMEEDTLASEVGSLLREVSQNIERKEAA